MPKHNNRNGVVVRKACLSAAAAAPPKPARCRARTEAEVDPKQIARTVGGWVADYRKRKEQEYIEAREWIAGDA